MRATSQAQYLIVHLTNNDDGFRHDGEFEITDAGVLVLQAPGAFPSERVHYAPGRWFKVVEVIGT